MVYAIHWTDMLGVERSAYSDDPDTAQIVTQALRGDHRLYALAPSIENMGNEPADGGSLIGTAAQ